MFYSSYHMPFTSLSSLLLNILFFNVILKDIGLFITPPSWYYIIYSLNYSYTLSTKEILNMKAQVDEK